MERMFPEQSWAEGLAEKLNNDPSYNQTARGWEGDLLFIIEPDEILDRQVVIYLDLWHGKCRGIDYLDDPSSMSAAYRFQAPYRNFARILRGDWPAMQALLTRKLHVSGSMSYLVRNLPTVLEFVRCCQENTTSILGEGSPAFD